MSINYYYTSNFAMNKKEKEEEAIDFDVYYNYIYNRTPHRCLGGAVLGCMVVIPTSMLAFRSQAFHRFRDVTKIPFFMPIRVQTAAALGAVAGILEDFLVRVSYEETIEAGRPIDVSGVYTFSLHLSQLSHRTYIGYRQVEMWTARSLGPALLFYAHPFLAWKCLHGEQKGCDVAMALVEKKPFQLWPFFSVQKSNEGQLERLRRRLWNGTFTSEEADNRNPLDEFWHPITSLLPSWPNSGNPKK